MKWNTSQLLIATCWKKSNLKVKKKLKNNNCKNMHGFLIRNIFNELQKPKIHKKILRKSPASNPELQFFKQQIFPRALKVTKLSKF